MQLARMVSSGDAERGPGSAPDDAPRGAVRRRETSRRLRRRSLLVSAGLGGLAVAALAIAASERLEPGTVVAGIDVGGRTRAEATALIREKLLAFERNPVTLRLDARSWTPTADDLGVSIDYEATVAGALPDPGVGRAPRWLRAALAPAETRRTVPVVLVFDAGRLREFLEGIGREVAVPPRDARLAVATTGVRVEDGRAGSTLDVAAATTGILSAIERLEPTVVRLVATPAPPDRSAPDLAPALGVANRLTGDPVVLRLWGREWRVGQSDLLSALVLPDDPTLSLPRLDPTRLAAAVDGIAAEIDHEAVNATLGWDGRLQVIDPGYAGTKVDRPALADAIAAAAATDQRTAEVPVGVEPAALRGDNLAELGIATRLAVGESSFAGSSAARATNVAVATDHVSPTLVPPGATFSFNDALGPITLDNGYVEGKIIRGDWFTSDLGGGVCQVSTTVFRAALMAGLSFVEWHPHTFRLPFYELAGWPPGMDAAIYQSDDPKAASLDLKFANATDGWLLLQLRIDGDDLVAELYGPPTGYQVRIDAPEFGEPLPAPPPVERASTELPPGRREVVQQPQAGVTVRVRRRVTSPAGVVSDTTFVSPYRPQAEVVAVGADTEG